MDAWVRICLKPGAACPHINPLTRVPSCYVGTLKLTALWQSEWPRSWSGGGGGGEEKRRRGGGEEGRGGSVTSGTDWPPSDCHCCDREVSSGDISSWRGRGGWGTAGQRRVVGQNSKLDSRLPPRRHYPQEHSRGRLGEGKNSVFCCFHFFFFSRGNRLDVTLLSHGKYEEVLSLLQARCMQWDGSASPRGPDLNISLWDL